jgi:hypothetical protein
LLGGTIVVTAIGGRFGNALGQTPKVGDARGFAIGQERTTAASFDVIADGVTDDSLAFQNLLERASASQRPVRPLGRILVGRSIRLHDGSQIAGEGTNASVIVAQADKDILIADPAARNKQLKTWSLNLRLSDLTLRGGRRAMNLDVQDVVASHIYDRVTFDGSTEYDLYVNRMLVGNNFNRVIFNGHRHNIYVASGVSNLNSFYSSEFRELGGTAITFLGGSQANTFIAPRFEGQRDIAPNSDLPVIKLENATGFSITGGYFENVHRTILRETTSHSQVWFAHTRFSGQEAQTAASEEFQSNGAVGFFSNEFRVGSHGAEQMMLLGRNKGLDTRRSWIWRHFEDGHLELSSPLVSVIRDDPPYALFEFTRDFPTADAEDLRAFVGEMVVTCIGRSSTGQAWSSRASFSISVMADRLETMELATKKVVQMDHGTASPGISLEASGASASTLTVRVRLAVIPQFGNGLLKATLRGECLAGGDLPQIRPTPVLSTGRKNR